MRRHLEIEQLIGYAEGKLSQQQMPFVEKHVRECHPCTRELHDWVDIFTLLRGFSLERAPDEALRICRAIYRAPERTSRLREIFANLIFDSFAQPATAGVRGEADSRQLLLKGGDVDLHLRISQVPNLMLGQLLQRTDTRFVSGVRIQIVFKGESVGTTVTDSLGEFRFQELPSGNLQLCADLPKEVRLIADLPLTDN